MFLYHGLMVAAGAMQIVWYDNVSDDPTSKWATNWHAVLAPWYALFAVAALLIGVAVARPSFDPRPAHLQAVQGSLRDIDSIRVV